MRNFTADTVDRLIYDYDSKAFLSTGFDALDEHLVGNGVREQRLIALLGEAKVGKTYLLINWMQRLAFLGQKSYFFSGEMPESDILFRSFQVGNCMSWQEVKKRINNKDKAWINESARKILGNIELDFARPLSLEYIEEQVKLWRNEIHWFFIDNHMKIVIKTPGRGGGKDLYSRISEILTSLSDLVQETNSRIVLCVKANRGVADGATLPAMHDGRGSGNLEDVVNSIIGICLPERNQKCVEELQHSILLRNLGNRDGGTGKAFSLFFNEHTGVLYDTRAEMIESLPLEGGQKLF